MTYTRKTSDRFSFSLSATHSRVVEERTDEEPETDPTPSCFPPLRVVTTDGETVSETTKPYELAKCRQITPFAAKLKRFG